MLLSLILAASLLAILSLALWSFAGIWRFPDALPQAWSLATWRAQGQALAAPTAATLGLASASTLLALVLVLLCLEAESRFALAPGRAATLILYLPMLLPQIAFLFGLQVVLVRLRLDGTAVAVVWAHWLFVLPYVYLSLADPWRALDPRVLRAAAALGAGPWRCFLTVKLLLLRPVLAAAAVGFGVSVGLYLPTLFAGAGRIATLTTEAITLAAGSDRRILGAYALLQAVLPLLVTLWPLLRLLIPRFQRLTASAVETNCRMAATASCSAALKRDNGSRNVAGRFETISGDRRFARLSAVIVLELDELHCLLFISELLQHETRLTMTSQV